MKFKFNVDLDYARLDPIQLNYGEFEDGLVEALTGAYRRKEEQVGHEDMRTLERMISLQIIDTKWRDHLYNMDELRDGIWTLSYGERNPLVEYKIQGFNLFRGMLSTLKEDILEFMMRVQVERVVQEEPAIPESSIAGSEFHAEVEQFGGGGIPMSRQASPQQRRAEPRREQNQPTEGGVKRKKSRRSRRG